MRLKAMLAVAAIALALAAPLHAANLRWAAQNDILTLDPHSQNHATTNAILMQQKLDLFTPSDQLTFSVHLDGMRERHDESVGREGVFDIATAAIREAKRRGFRVNINTTLFQTAKPDEVAEFFSWATNDLKVDGITFSPGFAYEHAPRQDVFMGRRQSKELMRKIFTNRQQHHRK